MLTRGGHSPPEKHCRDMVINMIPCAVYLSVSNLKSEKFKNIASHGSQAIDLTGKLSQVVSKDKNPIDVNN